MINKVLEDIKNRYNNKYILAICKKLERKYNKSLDIKSVSVLELISMLGTCMYINDDFDNAVKILSMTDEVEFSGNWDIWDRVYTCQILKARVYSRLGKNDVSEEIKKNLNIRTTGGCLNWESNIDKNCTVYFDSKYNKRIDQALEENDLKYVFELRLNKLIKILKYIEGSAFVDIAYESNLKSADELIEEITQMN